MDTNIVKRDNISNKVTSTEKYSKFCCNNTVSDLIILDGDQIFLAV